MTTHPRNSKLKQYLADFLDRSKKPMVEPATITVTTGPIGIDLPEDEPVLEAPDGTVSHSRLNQAVSVLDPESTWILVDGSGPHESYYFTALKVASYTGRLDDGHAVNLFVQGNDSLWLDGKEKIVLGPAIIFSGRLRVDVLLHEVYAVTKGTSLKADKVRITALTQAPVYNLTTRTISNIPETINPQWDRWEKSGIGTVQFCGGDGTGSLRVMEARIKVTSPVSYEVEIGATSLVDASLRLQVKPGQRVNLVMDELVVAGAIGAVHANLLTGSMVLTVREDPFLALKSGRQEAASRLKPDVLYALRRLESHYNTGKIDTIEELTKEGLHEMTKPPSTVYLPDGRKLEVSSDPSVGATAFAAAAPAGLSSRAKTALEHLNKVGQKLEKSQSVSPEEFVNFVKELRAWVIDVDSQIRRGVSTEFVKTIADRMTVLERTVNSRELKYENLAQEVRDNLDVDLTSELGKEEPNVT